MASASHNLLFPLKEALIKYADATAFMPYRAGSWDRVSFEDHHKHLALATSFWSKELSAIGLRQHDIVGIWVTGNKYEDIIQIMALIGAGYVPQLFSVNFTDVIILTLLGKSGAKALVVDQQYAENASGTTVPVLKTPSIAELQVSDGSVRDLDNIPCVVSDDIAFIVHSSGTTSGMPKLIPQNHKWARAVIDLKWRIVGSGLTTTVMNVLGSLAHVGSVCSYIGSIATGVCTVQPSSMGFPTDELLRMVNECGLNVVNLYAPFAAMHIENAKTRPDVLHALQGLRKVLYTGVSMDEGVLRWGYEHCIPLVNYYGTSETAPLMVSTPDFGPDSHLLQVIDGLAARLVPMNAGNGDDSNVVPLYEMVVPKDAPDSPHSSFIDADGFFHTDDLFELVNGTGYVYRGRANDWIKCIMGLVDTKSIEDAVRKNCEGIIRDVVVIGQNRPLPVLAVEVASSSLADDGFRHTVTTRIVERMSEYNEGKFKWDRVDDPKRIIVVAQRTFPRTREKGNIRRNATDDMLAANLEAIFASQ